jgi:hypothetical protein
MTEYEKLSLLYLAHIAGLLHVQIKGTATAGLLEWLAKDFQKDIRKVASKETLVMLSDGASI